MGRRAVASWSHFFTTPLANLGGFDLTRNRLVETTICRWGTSERRGSWALPRAQKTIPPALLRGLFRSMKARGMLGG